MSPLATHLVWFWILAVVGVVAASTLAVRESRRDVGSAARTNPLAVGSVVLGLLWFGGLGSLAAVVLGVRARRQLEVSGGRGSVLAAIGVLLGLLGIVATVAAVWFLVTLARGLGNLTF